MIVTFHGVRGSTPCHSIGVTGVGGNTSCVSITHPGEQPLLFDLGTGLRYFAASLDDSTPFRGTALLSHLHWDHVQGLPFFHPLLRPGADLQIHAPTQDDGSHPGDAMKQTFRPPFFPVTLDDIAGDVEVHCAKPQFSVGSYRVTSADVPHNGATVGYRVELGDASVAYVPDHQEDLAGGIAESVVELCRGVDLLIHDAQYTADDLAQKATWGHCTPDYAVAVATAAQVKRLALFHHDPAHDDRQVEAMAARAAALAAGSGVEVFTACERMSVELAV